MSTVAKHSGVSIAAVSRVLLGDARAREETVQRVMESARTVGDRLNGAARALVTQRHGTIAAVFPTVSGHSYAGVILGLEEASIALGQSVLIAGTYGGPCSEELVSALATRVDGLVLFGRTVSDRMVLELEARRVPVVLLARPQVGSAIAVRAENRRSAQALTAHLIGHGHDRIAFVGDPCASPDAAERWAGYGDAHREAGIRPPMAPEVCGFREADGRRSALQALTRGPAPAALFCASDEIAMGAYAAAAELGVAVPEEVAITGWDDIPIARFLSPALTTVRQPLAEMGARAAHLLSAAIEHRPFVGEVAPLPTELFIRASCGC
ncbi:MAG TPA: LacI family DNA-binding transcriptional regulator [Candidatus Dormibacteraeota bacterium]|jgi:LacI family transcriptional regulator